MASSISPATTRAIGWSPAAPIANVGDAAGRLKDAVGERLQRLWPQIGDVKFDYVWNGYVGMTTDFLPRIHASAPMPLPGPAATAARWRCRSRSARNCRRRRKACRAGSRIALHKTAALCRARPAAPPRAADADGLSSPRRGGNPRGPVGTAPTGALHRMGKQSQKSLADQLKPFVAPFSFDGSGEFHLKSHKTRREGRSRQGEGRKDHRGQPRAAERSAGKALRPGPLVAAADLSGHGCLRQGFRDQERVRRRQSAGLRGHLVQAAVVTRARPRFPLAQPDRAAAARPHRHLQSLPLRGMPGGARASGNPRQTENSAKARHQKHLARPL